MIPKQWYLYPENKVVSEKLATALGVSPLIAQLLLNRKINSLDQAKSFLNPALTAASQFEKRDLDQAIDLISRCIAHNRTILLYGDYDVDGMSGTAMMAHFLTEIGARVDIYIPHRFRDGYGLNINIIPRIIEKAAALLITLDCGISNLEEIAQIKQTGVSVVIMDHHNIPEILPPADVMINPKFFPSNHHLAPLCTAGIVYKFIEYASKHWPQITPEDYLDLAALGTIADVAALRGENRRITQQGLRAMTRTKRPGLNALIDIAQLKKGSISTRDIGFAIAPRLNAAGRLGHAQLGVDLLLAKTPEIAQPLAEKLNQLNETRKAMGTAIMGEAVGQLQDQSVPLIALASHHWHAGVIGIIAARLVEKYGKPSVLIAIQDGLGRASARSIGDVNIYKVLFECKHLFKTFGGHKEAAGFSILPEKIPEFCDTVVEVAKHKIHPDELIPSLDIELSVPVSELGIPLAKQLDQLGPFGQGNPSPILHTKDLRVIEAKAVGKGDHLKVTFTDVSGTRIIDGIGFGLAHKLETAYHPQIDIAFTMETNTWGGKELPQLNLIDLKEMDPPR